MRWFDERRVQFLNRYLEGIINIASTGRRILASGDVPLDRKPADTLRRFVEKVARDATDKLYGSLLTGIREIERAKREKLEKRIARLEQFHCEHEFSEVKKGCLASLFCAKCDAVNPAWRKLALPIDRPECDVEQWENASLGWRPRDKRAIYVRNDGYYVPVAPPKEAP